MGVRRSHLTMVFSCAVACAEPRPFPDPTGSSGIHGGGIMDPAEASEFHGDLVRRFGWGFAACAECHAADFSGGPSGVSCLECHEDGPTACDVCHALPPPTGAPRRAARMRRMPPRARPLR